MRLDVYITPAEVPPGALAGRVVAVIDVLRASTTITVAIANGARAVIPLEETEDVVARAKQMERDSVILAGERRMRPIPGFDLGNSPAEFTGDAVRGRTVLLTTTNGTRALVAAQSAAEVVVAAYVNSSAVVALLRAALRGGRDAAIVCAGREREFSLEDAGCAGAIVRGVARRRAGLALNDAAHACALLARTYGDDLGALFRASSHGRALAEAGFGGDLATCAAVDSYPVVPIYADRQITALGERER